MDSSPRPLARVLRSRAGRRPAAPAGGRPRRVRLSPRCPSPRDPRKVIASIDPFLQLLQRKAGVGPIEELPARATPRERALGLDVRRCLDGQRLGLPLSLAFLLEHAFGGTRIGAPRTRVSRCGWVGG